MTAIEAQRAALACLFHVKHHGAAKPHALPVWAVLAAKWENHGLAHMPPLRMVVLI